MNKKKLAVMLSKLDSVSERSAKLEQYPTDPEIAAEVLWNAFMMGDIEGKTIADFGCGNGIFGIGALLLGARKVVFLDIDKKSILKAKENKEKAEAELGTQLDAEFQNIDVADFVGRADVVIQNPPFGVKKAHADRAFLEKAMATADKVYSFQKTSTEPFIVKLTADTGFEAVKKGDFKFPLKQSFSFHTKKVYHADVSVWKIVKKFGGSYALQPLVFSVRRRDNTRKV